MDKNAVSLTSPSLHRDWFRVLHRQWKPALSHVQFAVVEMVFDRTLGWGKEWEYITYEQFIEGVWTADGKVIHPGTGYQRRAVAEALVSLLKRGVIRRIKTTKKAAVCYALIFEWIPDMNIPLPKRLREPKVEPEKPVSKYLLEPSLVSFRNNLSIPRKLKEEGIEEGRKLTTSANAELAKPEESENEKIETNFKTAKRVDTVGDALSQLTSEHSHRHSARLQKRELGRSELMSIWQRAFVETFQQSLCVPLKAKDIGALRAYSKRWQGASVANKDTLTFGAFVDWSIRKWKVVLDTEMQWCKQPPALPAPLFLIRFGEHFERAFAARDAIARRMGMTTHQRIVTELVEGGMPADIAAQEADTKTGVSKQREKIEQEKDEVMRQRRLLDIEREQARTRMRNSQAIPERRPVEHVQPVEAFNFDDCPPEFPDYE